MAAWGKLESDLAESRAARSVVEKDQAQAVEAQDQIAAKVDGIQDE